MASVLVINFFPAFMPPSSGGEMRLGTFYRALSEFNDVTLITSTDFGARFEEILHTPRFRELRFPKDALWRNAYATLDRLGLKGDLSGLAFALAVSEPACELRQRVRTLAATADVVVHEFPFSEPIFSDGCPCPEVYNSHNFEIALLPAVVHGDGFDEALLKLLRLEGNLVERARHVFAVSADDAQKFRLFYGVNELKIGLCPNGIDPLELAPITAARKKRGKIGSARPKLFFIASGHYPNVEAADFLVDIASALSDCDLILAGDVCKPFSARVLPGNVILLGLVDPLTKARLFSEVDIFVNPVVLGSGTSLKALEALGAGVPMVSTAEGVRGLDVNAGVQCEIAVREDFVGSIRGLLDDPERRKRMAAAGIELAYDRYSWPATAKAFSERVTGPAPKIKAATPLVLALNDYPVLQSGSGGAARIRSLLTQFRCDVVLLSFGATFDVVLIAPGFVHATIPKTVAHRAFESAVNRGQPMSVNDGVAALFAGSNPALVELASAIARRAQAVVFEHPYMAPLLDAILAARPGLRVVYSAHNVEATHKRAILQGHRLAQTLVTFIVGLERRMVSNAQLVVCCTDTDAGHFARLGADVVVVPNGCALPAQAIADPEQRVMPKSGGRYRAGFLGSAHGPNVEAAKFIIRELAPAMPEVEFEFIGGVCSALDSTAQSNVVLHRTVSESVKSSIMYEWQIALNPLQSGGGSSLKVPDFLAHGLAVISTPIGTRGFSIDKHGAGVLVDRSRFAETLRAMIGDPALLARQQASARRFAAEHLTWDVIAKPYREAVSKLVKTVPASTAGGKRLLVVTYRYTEPSLGGAEEFLVEILKRLRPRFSRLDLAAVDIDHLTNHFHFGCRMTTVEGGGSRRLGRLFDQARYFRPDEITDEEMQSRSRTLERAWTREERKLLSRFVGDLGSPGRMRLFGGFFGPEDHGGFIRRWTSPEFAFIAPQHSRSFKISGYAATDKILSITLMQISTSGDASVIARYRELIQPYFSVSVALPKARKKLPLIICCEVDEHEAPNDHRPLGILLDSATVLVDATGALDHAGIAPLQVQSTDMSEQYDQELRTSQFDRWVAALRDVSLERDDATEADFSAVRGPHSRALQSWLAAHARDYDSVLVQGIPFDMIPSTVATLGRVKNRPRVVTLPHFHGDDRFYYWRRYLDAFSAADATLLFSASIAEHLEAPDRHLDVVPGGGIRADEHGDPTAVEHFRQAHTGPNPFFLVLGRKIASKGYEQAIRAHQELRRSGCEIDLVMIGPDEDGRSVSAPGVHYLGQQPRSVIRGGLSCCLGLINMSRSESFGIVICEAWLFGKPVIANGSCYAFRDLVRSGETGLLVTHDIELVEAMRRLVEHPEERARMGEAGFNDVIERYTWERVAEECLKALVPEIERPQELTSATSTASTLRSRTGTVATGSEP